jgi:MoaA/NifB/PqqE/SkfB family radical SAM enzyme
MSFEGAVTTFLSHRRDGVANAVATALQYGPVRRGAAAYVERFVDEHLEKERPSGVRRDAQTIVRALVHTIDDRLAQGYISSSVVRNALSSLLLVPPERREASQRFRREHGGQYPPGFLVLSPTKLCNLHCKGCYASSGKDEAKLDWDVFDRTITEAKNLWGAGFMVISGGEPLTYRSQGHHLLDAMEKHQDVFFLMFTNGTLIDKRMAAHMGELSNITPAISVEGLEASTDARRGDGVFKRVLRAMGNLREVGVPFGVSITATRENCEEILSDEFLHLFLDEQAATYGWIFQYMPIGRSFTLDLLPTPQQRAWMWRRTWDVIQKKDYFLIDFWNSGSCSDGCVSAGRGGGYLYIDWNGQVMPCVFIPYSPVNIYDVYREGKTLNDLLDEPFFEAIRDWQRTYGLDAKRPEEHGNWLMPCPIRDHHAEFRRILNTTEPDPEDEAALHAMIDADYRDGLIAYDEAVAKALDPIWEEEYIRPVSG